ncbi:hypothetical protein, partial [Embleya sp. NPDC020886]|uniref:hypothetical protein n=1 Tax=Embleya sp. NPDC020886 TaxID=3363980 RepID=UPI00378F98E1
VRDVLNRSAHRTSSRIVLLDCCYSGLAGAMGSGTLTRTDLRHSLSEDEDAVVVSGGRGGCGGGRAGVDADRRRDRVRGARERGRLAINRPAGAGRSSGVMVR